MTKKSSQKRKYFENNKSFGGEINQVDKTFLRSECPPLR